MPDRSPDNLGTTAAPLVFAGVLIVIVIIGAVLAIVR